MNSSMNLVQTYQGGLGLGDRDYYLKEDEHSKEIRTKYQEHIGRCSSWPVGKKKKPGRLLPYGYRNPIGRSCL